LNRSAIFATASVLGVRGQVRACDGRDSRLLLDPERFIDLPASFRYRVLARGGDMMSDGWPRPPDPDLNVFIGRRNGTAYLVTNHEIGTEHGPSFTGSVTRLRLDKRQRVVDSRLLSDGMWNNCLGCRTHWGTVLSCEEFPRKPSEDYPDEGFVWEVNIRTGAKVRRDALGRFSHEGAIIAGRAVYLTEDDLDGGCLYRFVPRRWGDLSEGSLQALDSTRRRWVPVSDPYNARAEAILGGATVFGRLEGMAVAGPERIFIAETSPGRETPFGQVLKLNPRTREVRSFLRCDGAAVASPDNLGIGPGGFLYVFEDKPADQLAAFGANKIVRVLPDRGVIPFALVHGGEPTGPAFGPGGKLFLSVMNGTGGATVLIERRR
jgi:secreted PhoX family phosphatase